MKKASKKISEGLAKIGIAPPKEGEIKHITEEEMIGPGYWLLYIELTGE